MSNLPSIDTIVGRQLKALRRADEKLRRGDSISNADLKILYQHYKELEELTGMLPQFYCAHQEAVRRFHQVNDYLKARNVDPSSGEPESATTKDDEVRWTTQLIDHDTKG